MANALEQVFNSKGQNIGYVRVSTADQNTARQLDDIVLDRVFIDTVSGKDKNRPQLQACLGFLREGDTLYVHSMDRLARNLSDLREIVHGLTAKGVTVIFHKERMTFNGEKDIFGNLMLNLLGAVAEFEREMILERQREGIAKAKAEGKYKGRKRELSDADIAFIRSNKDTMTKAEIARRLGRNRSTVYEYLEERQAA